MVMGCVPLINVANDLKSILDAIFIDCSRLQSSNILLSRIAQHVICVFASQADKLARLRPVDVARFNLNPANELASFPIEEANTALTLDTKQDTTTETFSSKADIDAAIARFGFEVAEDLDRVL